MQQRYEFVDLIVAIGLFATIVAGGLLFLAADGKLSLSPARLTEGGQLSGMKNGTEWLEPVLGRAIVDYDLHERRYEKLVPAAVARLDRLAGENIRWNNSPFGYLEAIKISAVRVAADHRARVQMVMGRAIMHFTKRGVRVGLLPSEGITGDFNARMIGKVDARGRQMDAQLIANWQPSLGRRIVSASQENAKKSAVRQERLGAAIVQQTSLRSSYERAHVAIQEQLGGAIVVAIQTEFQTTLEGRKPSGEDRTGTISAQKLWPEIPMISLTIASILLVSLFSAGLMGASRLADVHAKELAQAGTDSPVHAQPLEALQSVQVSRLAEGAV